MQRAHTQATRWIQRTGPEDPEVVYAEAIAAVALAVREYRPGPRSFPTYAYGRVEQRLSTETAKQFHGGPKRARALRSGAAPQPRDLRPLELDATVETEDGPQRLGAILADPGPTPEQMVIERERVRGVQREVRGALCELTPRERRVVQMIHSDGQSMAHIARILGITVFRVKQLEESGLAKLREALAGMAETE